MYSVGVDLGGTKICTGIVDERGQLIVNEEVATGAAEGPDAVIERIVASIRNALKGQTREMCAGIGIAAPGPLDYPTGTLKSPPNLPGWESIALRDIVAKEFGLKTYLDNDANAAAIAEHRFGAGERTDNMVYVTVSTGIGAGVILDGKIRRGETGSAAELGHSIIAADGPLCTCGNYGCLETLASGTAIARRATERFGKPLTARDVAVLAAQHDEVAEEILHDAFHYLGIGLVNAVNLFDPSLIVIGGGLSQIGGVLFGAIRRELANNQFRHASVRTKIRVVQAALGTKAGVIGAGVLPFLGE